MTSEDIFAGSRWIVTGTPVREPYPCRCHEAKYGACSVKWCPCVGRLDRENLPEMCCGQVWGPEAFMEAWRATSQ